MHAATENASTSTRVRSPGQPEPREPGSVLEPRRSPSPQGPGSPRAVLGGSDEFKTAGWVFHRDDIFVRPRLTALFEALRAEPAVKRCKGVLSWRERVGRPGREGRRKLHLRTRGSSKRQPFGNYRRRVEGGAGRELRRARRGERGERAAALDWDAVERAVLAALKPQRPAK